MENPNTEIKSLNEIVEVSRDRSKNVHKLKQSIFLTN